MKKGLFILVAALVMVGVSCSDKEDDMSKGEEFVDDKESLIGDWELRESMLGWQGIFHINPQQCVVKFNEGGTAEIKSVSERDGDAYFLRTGSYSYHATSDSLIFESRKYAYHIKGKILWIFDNPEGDGPQYQFTKIK